MSDIIFIWLHRIISGFSFFIIVPFFVLEYEKGSLNTLIDVNQYVVIFSILDGVLITGLSRYLRANIADLNRIKFAIAFIFYIYCILAFIFSAALYISDFKYFEFVLIPILLLPFRVVISHYFSANQIGKLKKAEVLNTIIRLSFLYFLIEQKVELSLFILCYTLTPALVYFVLYFHVKLHRYLVIDSSDYGEVMSILKNNASGLFFTVPWVIFSTNAILSIPNEQLYSTESKLLLSLFIAYMGFLGAFDMSLTPKIMNKSNQVKNVLFKQYFKWKTLINLSAVGVVFLIPGQLYTSLIGGNINGGFIKENLFYFVLFFAIFISHSGLIKSYIISTKDYLGFSILQGSILLLFFAFSGYSENLVTYFVYTMALKSIIDLVYFTYRCGGSFFTFPK